MKKTTKKILSFILTFAMLVGMMPAAVFATETEVPSGDDSAIVTETQSSTEDSSVNVYFSVSHDAGFVKGEETGTVMALQEVEVPYFDLAEYGLSQYAYQTENRVVTMLHLFIYATELYYYGLEAAEAGQGYLYDNNILGTSVLTFEGAAGSLFTPNFWNMDLNLNYYNNYEYPLAAEGWGATADQVALEDGDVITIGHFTSWDFYNDPSSIFNFAKIGDTIGMKKAKPGEQLTVGMYRGGADFSGNYTTAHETLTSQPAVYYGTVGSITETVGGTGWTSLGNASTEGTVTFNTTDLAEGKYMVAMAGQYGTDYPDAICSTPGGIIVEVKANTEPELKDGVSASISEDIQVGKTYSVALNDIFADYHDDAMTYTVSVNGADAVSADAAYSYTPDAAGEVTLVFAASDGNLTSTETYTVTLNATQAPTEAQLTPSLVIEPETANYTYGTTVPTLAANATVEVTGELTYQWSKAVGQNKEVIEGATESTYTPDAGDAGTITYYCTVTNTYSGVEYTATASATVNCDAAQLPTAAIDSASFTYDGEAKTPVITIEGLTAGTDYTLSGDLTATEAGDHTITVTGIGNYTGTQTITWSIAIIAPEQDADGVYLIDSAADLTWVALSVNAGTAENQTYNTASYKLTADIDLSSIADWTQIGLNGANTYFMGTFDGNGHTISNMTLNWTGVDEANGASGYGIPDAGLFGYTKNAAIKNLNLSGTITLTNASKNLSAARVGGVAGYSNGTVFENIVSDVDITLENEKYFTANAWASIGGIVGYAYTGTQIINCMNLGDISGLEAVGGIAGNIRESVMTGCANYGNITGFQYVGGIAGSPLGCEITNSYNVGNVDVSLKASGVKKDANAAGGILGRDWASSATSANTITNCFTTGTVTGALYYYPEKEDTFGTFVGDSSTYSTYTNCYALAVDGAKIVGDDADSTIVTGKTEDEMKSGDFVSLLNGAVAPAPYAAVCGEGYPALTYQTNVTFHTKDSAVVTAPTCVANGYTTYTCSSCSETYTSDIVAALGHDWCEDLAGCDDCEYTAPTCVQDGEVIRICRREGCDEEHEAVVPATGHTEDPAQTVVYDNYKLCVCSVCDSSYRVWNNELLQNGNIEGMGVESVVVAGSIDYPWAWNAETQRYESTNKAVKSSTSESTVTITLASEGTVSFHYGVSSENRYDKLTIKLNDEVIADAISNVTTGSYENVLEAGTYTLTLSYTKDGSGDKNEDVAWISDLSIETPAQVSAEVGYDYYVKGDTVTVVVKAYTSAFDTTMYALEYDTNLMVYKDAELGEDFMNLSLVYDKNTGSIVRKAFAIPGTTIEVGEEGIVIDTLTFTMLETGTPALSFVSVDDGIDAVDQAVLMRAGQEQDAATAVVYVEGIAADMAAAEVVDKLIDAIGTPVTVDSEEAIVAAREAYDALTEEQKELVTKLGVLTDAEAALAAAKEAAEAAQRAAEVDALIEAIGEVNVDSADSITAAREAYDALTDIQKELVTKLDALEDAEEVYELSLIGDVNFDGKINSMDLSILLSVYGADSAACDLNNDSIVNSADLSILLANYGTKK